MPNRRARTQLYKTKEKREKKSKKGEGVTYVLFHSGFGLVILMLNIPQTF
jgi:hypothetical protein